MNSRRTCWTSSSGGNTGDITIRSNLRSRSTLLIVGDDSVLPVIPFLASHYSQIRFVDLADLSEEQIAQIDCSQYQRLLIAYSVDTFIHEDIPEKVALLQTAQTEEAISLQPAEDTQQDAGQAVP